MMDMPNIGMVYVHILINLPKYIISLQLLREVEGRAFSKYLTFSSYRNMGKDQSGVKNADVAEICVASVFSMS